MPGNEVTQANMRLQIVDMRRSGASHRQIAQHLGINQSRVTKIINTELNKIAKATLSTAEHLQAIEIERLDRLQMSVWRSAAEGDLESIQTVLKIIDLRAKISGIYAKQKEKSEENDAIEGSAVYLHLPTTTDEWQRAAQSWNQSAQVIEANTTPNNDDNSA